MKQLTSGNGILALRKEMDRLFDRVWDRDWMDVAQLAEGGEAQGIRAIFALLAERYGKPRGTTRTKSR